MAVYHDEIEIEDFEFDESEETYYYPCPCGDRLNQDLRTILVFVLKGLEPRIQILPPWVGILTRKNTREQ